MLHTTGLLGKAWVEQRATWVSDIAEMEDFRRAPSCLKLGLLGTSGVVYPAAAFVHWARGATLELNLEPSAGATDFAESRQGPATRLVPFVSPFPTMTTLPVLTVTAPLRSRTRSG